MKSISRKNLGSVFLIRYVSKSNLGKIVPTYGINPLTFLLKPIYTSVTTNYKSPFICVGSYTLEEVNVAIIANSEGLLDYHLSIIIWESVT